MLTCPHCKNAFTSDDDGLQAVCPHCRTVVDRPPPTEWVSIVRCTNVAEAGYLANVLAGEGIETHIEQHDSFSAIDGHWVSMFLLQAPADAAQRAAERIRDQLAQDEVAAADSYLDPPPAAQTKAPPAGREHAPVEAGIPFGRLTREDTPAPADWRPLALILLAGVAIVVIGLQLRESNRRPAQPPTGPMLLRALEQIDRPFVSQPRPGDPRRYRLRFDGRRRIWHLDVDTNGDGRYDRRKAFR
jgi:hypothetical protein